MPKTIVHRHVRKTKRKTIIVKSHQRNYEFKGYYVGSDGKKHRKYGYTEKYKNSREHARKLGLD